MSEHVTVSTRLLAFAQKQIDRLVARIDAGR